MDMLKICLKKRRMKHIIVIDVKLHVIVTIM